MGSIVLGLLIGVAIGGADGAQSEELTRANDRVASLEQELGDQEAESSSLEEDYNALFSENANLEAQNARLEDRADDLEAKLEELQDRQEGTGPDEGGNAGGGSAATITDGIWEVGTDIQPGTYRTTVPGGRNALCYWARLRNFGGEGIITNGLAEGGEAVIVQILPTDAGFESNDCGTWTKTS